MRKRAGLSVVIALFALTFALAGCGVSPQRQFAISPDGGRVAYANYPNIGSGVDIFANVGKSDDTEFITSMFGKAARTTGITVKDLRTGEAKSIYTAKPHFVIHAVFWSEKKNAVYFLESNYYIAIKKKIDKFIFNFKQIDPDTGEITVLKSKMYPVRNYSLEGLKDLTMLINFDEETGLLTAGSKMWTIGKKNSSLEMIILEFVKRPETLAGDFNISPDRKHMSYLAPGNDTNNDLLEILVINLTTLDIKTVYSASKDDESYPMNFMHGTRWSPDGKFLYYMKNYKDMLRLMRYDTTTGKTKKMSDEQIITFDVFPDGNKLLLLHLRGAKGYMSILGADGKIMDTYEAVYPGHGGFSKTVEKPGKQIAFAYLKVAADGKHAVAASLSIDNYWMAPLIIYDLEAHTASALAETENENLVAGLFHSFYKRYDKAAENFRGAGDRGSVQLYLILRKENDEEGASAALEKALSYIKEQNPEVDAHYILARTCSNSGTLFDCAGKDIAPEEYKLVEGAQKGKAYYYLSELSKGNEKIAWMEKSITEFRKQGCLENPVALCEGDIRLISYLPVQLAKMYLNRKTPDGNAAAAAELEQSKRYAYTMHNYENIVYELSGETYERTNECGKAIENYKHVYDEGALKKIKRTCHRKRK